ncbi:NBAS subunit of NRZ tethering complex-like [Mercenaria mercenaria]|uniref:NBAS subunit of NRZ tethering complex-like n=1 Tax=Mercenaria mercenaria TaxID=6596 RepID=UPI00234F23F4|nr:NBAS subunit of NRZ tethering complex-like [Mercenaria mercenaria]
MAASDVETEGENILYDLTVHAEWKQENEPFRHAGGRHSQHSALGKITSSTQRRGWTVLRSIGLPIQTASPCYLPPSLVKLVNCTINWQIAVSRDGSVVAVMQDQGVEIRSKRDDYAVVTGRVTLEKDGHPQWRRLVWSPDNTMIACSLSNGTVQVYDIVGTQLFSIPGKEVAPGVTDLSEAVVALIFTDKVPDKEWSSELLVINYHGKLSSYKVDRDKGCELLHTFVFNSLYPLGISCVEYHGEAGLLYVGGCGQEEEGMSEATKEGLTAWRILSDYPHYKVVTDYAEDLSRAQSQKSLRKRFKLFNWSRLRGEIQEGMFRLSLSPCRKYVVSVHFSGKVCLWAVPSLKLIRSWKQEEQPYADEISPEFTENPQVRKQIKDLVNTRNLLDINWWSEEAVILGRGTGAVTVSSISTLKNLLGNQPEWFEPAPRLSEVHDGGFLGLEVECRFPSKRRLVPDSGDEEDESDEEEAGLVSKSWGVAKQCLHYVTDMDTFKPPKKKPRLVNRTYRLVCLKSTTPEELFARKLENEEYGEAKALAQAYGLDVDLVYQRQWRKSPVEISSIQDYLSKISKRAWVLHECMERMSDKIDAMKELLEFGLRGTDLPALIMIGKGEDKGRFILIDPEDGLYEDIELDDFDPEVEEKREKLKQDRIDQFLTEVDFDNLTLEQRELCRARKKLLQYLYRLKTYEYILGGVSYAAERYDPKFFEKFRSQNIVELAVDYAQSSDWKALETLFTFHGHELLPHRLAILSNFPETTPPSEYKTLLPEMSESELVLWPTDRWCKLDWVDLEPCKTALEPNAVDLGEFIYEERPDFKKYRGNITGETLTDWYEYRGKEIERLSRQADSALELVKLAVERNVQGLENVLDDLVTMDMLVYSCHIDETLTFEELQEMADYDKLELLMSKSSDDMYSKNLRRWMVPFLKQCDRRTHGAYIHLLRDYVVTSARSDLTRPLHVFEASKTHLPNPVIPKQAELMSLGIDAIYSCQRDDQLHLAEEILKCLPQRGYGADTKEIQRLHVLVDKLEDHLNAAKVLAENGIKKPVYYIKETETNADEAEQLMIRLTRNMGRREGTASEVQWSRLHSEMMQLQDKVYRCVSPSLCHATFVESLLCSNNSSYIQLAGQMVERNVSESHRPTPLIYTMQTKVPYTKAAELVLMAAQEYFNSSASLTDTCMVLARSCLNLIQDSPPVIQEEHDLISSLSVLEDFGVKVLPLQVRLSKDRLELVQQAVDCKPASYTQKQKLLRLGHLLRITAVDRVDRDGKVLHILARAAVKNEDFPFAYDVCQELMSSCHGAAWDVCVDLAEHAAFQNFRAKVELLSFAVTFCTPDMIEPILQARALLETQVLFEGISSKVQESEEDSNKRVSPFSSKAALQQTQHILASTKQTTKAVLSTVTDSKWWHGTVNRLRQPMKRQESYDMTNRNKKLELQSCHPFYEGFIANCFSNVDEADFCHLETHVDMETQMSEKLLRTAQLEEMLTEGEKSQSATEVLLQLASECFCVDNTLSLAYLLALQQPTEADRCFDDHPRTDISLQLALYYYALQLYSAVRPVDMPHISPLYVREPVKVMQKVTSLVCQKKEIQWPDYVLDLVEKIKHYNEMLEDYRQAKILKKLDRGIDTERFTSDAEYKTETILGLAMTIEDSIYNISVSLAERYDIPQWQVYATHLEFLLCDSGLSVEELQARVDKLNIIEVLRSRPDEFCERMNTYVYPSLDGTDHQMLLFYYSTMQGCEKVLQGRLTADNHVKLLKRLKSVASGLDYGQLMKQDCDVIEVLSPCLTSSNVITFAKLAKQIPDGKGGVLDASIINCCWAAKFFWEGDGKKQPDTTAAWVHRYEACSEYIQKLHSHHVINFLQAVVFTEKSRIKLEVECRLEICKRMLKFARQQAHKKKKSEEESRYPWETVATVVQGYIKHLETLSNPVVMVMAESEVKQVQEYLKLYDLSMGTTNKVHELLVSIVLDGELSLDAVSEFLSAVSDKTWTIVTIVKDAVDYLLTCLSNKESVFKPLNVVDHLKSLEKIVENIQDHIEAGGDLISSEELMSQLRPFCSDSTVDVQPRLDVLYILEKSFKLSEEDSVLLTLYRTQAVVSEIWPQCQVTEAEIGSTESRHKLFLNLLQKSNTLQGDNNGKSQFSALCRLLKLWPSFSKLSDIEKPWSSLFKSMVVSGCHYNVLLVLDTVKTTETSLSFQNIETVYKEMVQHGYSIEAVKFSLITEQRELFSSAMDLLSRLPQINEDADLINLILKHHLVPDLVSTTHYPIIVQYVLTNQDPEIGSCNHLSVIGLANQLRDRGFEAEAGSLMLKTKAVPPLLQTFGTALGSFTKWFK